MKKTFLALLLVLTVFTLASCKSEDKKMQLLWWSDGTEGDVMQTLLDDYKEETGVEIELVPIAYDEYESKIATSISGGDAPALARVTEGHLNNFQDNILSLEGVYTSSNYTNLFYNSDGDVISLPMDITANGMFVNADLLDANGVDYPALGEDVWTWDEFHTEMMKLDGATGVAAPGVIDHKAHRFMPVLYQHGVTIWDTPYSVSNLTDQATVDAVDMFMDLFEEEFIPSNIFVVGDSAGSFKSGQYGFHISGNWNVSNYQDLGFTVKVVPMPQGTNRATILGGKSLAAFEGSGMEQEAKDFIAWMAEAEQHDVYTGTVPYLTPRLGATVDYGDFTDEYNVFLDEIAATDEAYVQDWLTQVMIPGMYPVINQFFEDMAEGDKTAAELLADLETSLKAIAPE